MLNLFTTTSTNLPKKISAQELKEALANVKTLSGLLPICYSCKKIRDDKGYWDKVDNYFRKRSDLKFSHGLCPDCAEVEMKHIKEGRQDR